MRSTLRTVLRTVDRADLRDALALAAAISVVGASFGALSAAAHIPVPIVIGLSLVVFAGGSQFLVVGVVAAGGDPFAAVLAGLLLNARHLPFGLAMSGVVADRWPLRMLGAHILIDEAVAFAKARGSGRRARHAYWMVGGLLFICWNASAAVGLLVGSAVPDPDAFGIDAAFPAGLIALLFPALRAVEVRRAGLAGAAVALAATPFLPAGLPLLGSLVGLFAAGRVRQP